MKFLTLELSVIDVEQLTWFEPLVTLVYKHKEFQYVRNGCYYHMRGINISF